MSDQDYVDTMTDQYITMISEQAVSSDELNLACIILSLSAGATEDMANTPPHYKIAEAMVSIAYSDKLDSMQLDETHKTSFLVSVVNSYCVALAKDTKVGDWQSDVLMMLDTQARDMKGKSLDYVRIWTRVAGGLLLSQERPSMRAYLKMSAQAQWAAVDHHMVTLKMGDNVDDLLRAVRAAADTAPDYAETGPNVVPFRRP